MLHDLLAAVRSLRRHPAFTALAGLTIALGIGATTAIFSVVEAIALRPLPYPNPDRLVDVSHMTKEGRRLLTSWFDVVDLRLETEIFEDVAARQATVFEMVLTSDGGEPYEAAALQATYNYLSVLGVNPVIGRTFTVEDAVAAEASEEEDAPDPVQTVVITYGLWQRMLGEDPNLAGRTIYNGGGQCESLVCCLETFSSSTSGGTGGWVTVESSCSSCSPRPFSRVAARTDRKGVMLFRSGDCGKESRTRGLRPPSMRWPLDTAPKFRSTARVSSRCRSTRSATI